MAILRSLRFKVTPPVSNSALNSLYRLSWPGHVQFNFTPVLRQSLTYVCGYQGAELVAFVYLAWDGCQHAFLLEPTVAPRLRRRGVGKQLVRLAVGEARKEGVDWVHVDFESRLSGFYRACGFAPTNAGVMDLRRKRRTR